MPLLVGEAATDSMQEIAREEPLMLVWWITPVECVSAISSTRARWRSGQRGGHRRPQASRRACRASTARSRRTMECSSAWREKLAAIGGRLRNNCRRARCRGCAFGSWVRVRCGVVGDRGFRTGRYRTSGRRGVMGDAGAGRSSGSVRVLDAGHGETILASRSSPSIATATHHAPSPSLRTARPAA